jgi:hypothetical protein
MDIDEFIETIIERRSGALEESRSTTHNNPSRARTLLKIASTCDVALAIALAGKEIAKAVDNRDHPEAITDREPQDGDFDPRGKCENCGERRQTTLTDLNNPDNTHAWLCSKCRGEDDV